MFNKSIPDQIIESGKARIQAYGDLVQLQALRQSLESASGIKVGYTTTVVQNRDKAVLTLNGVSVERRPKVVETLAKSPFTLYEEPTFN